MFIVGHVLQGLCTSLLLIASTPPLILGYPVRKLRQTAVIFNLCIFGAVAAGPLVGGAQASFHAWRPLFWIVAGIAFLGLVFSLLTFSDAPPADLSAPRDPVAIGLAASGAVLAFFGAAQLLTHGFFEPVAVVPLLVGIALIIAPDRVRVPGPSSAADPARPGQHDPDDRGGGRDVRGGGGDHPRSR